MLFHSKKTLKNYSVLPGIKLEKSKPEKMLEKMRKLKRRNLVKKRKKNKNELSRNIEVN